MVVNGAKGNAKYLMTQLEFTFWQNLSGQVRGSIPRLTVLIVKIKDKIKNVAEKFTKRTKDDKTQNMKY